MNDEEIEKPNGAPADNVSGEPSPSPSSSTEAPRDESAEGQAPIDPDTAPSSTEPGPPINASPHDDDEITDQSSTGVQPDTAVETGSEALHRNDEQEPVEAPDQSGTPTDRGSGDQDEGQTRRPRAGEEATSHAGKKTRADDGLKDSPDLGNSNGDGEHKKTRNDDLQEGNEQRRKTTVNADAEIVGNVAEKIEKVSQRFNFNFPGSDGADKQRYGNLRPIELSGMGLQLSIFGGSDVATSLQSDRYCIVVGLDEEYRNAAAKALVRPLLENGYELRMYDPPRLDADQGADRDYSFEPLEVTLRDQADTPTVVCMEVESGAPFPEFLKTGFRRANLSRCLIDGPCGDGGAQGHCLVVLFKLADWREAHRGRRTGDMKVPAWTVDWLRPRLRMLSPDLAEISQIADRIDAQRRDGLWQRDDEAFHNQIVELLERASAGPNPIRVVKDELAARDELTPEPVTGSVLPEDPLGLVLVFSAAFFPDISISNFREIADHLIPVALDLSHPSSKASAGSDTAGTGEFADTRQDAAKDANTSKSHGELDEDEASWRNWKSRPDDALSRYNLASVRASDSVVSIGFEKGLDAEDQRNAMVNQRPLIVEKFIREMVESDLLRRLDPSRSVIGASIRLIFHSAVLGLLSDENLARELGTLLNRFVPRRDVDEEEDADPSGQQETVAGQRASQRSGPPSQMDSLRGRAAVSEIAAVFNETTQEDLERYWHILSLTFKAQFDPGGFGGGLRQLLDKRRDRGHVIVRYVCYGLGRKFGYFNGVDLGSWLKRICSEADLYHGNWIGWRLSEDIFDQPEDAFRILEMLYQWLPENDVNTANPPRAAVVATGIFMRVLTRSNKDGASIKAVSDLSWHPLFGTINSDPKEFANHIHLIAVWLLHPCVDVVEFEENAYNEQYAQQEGQLDITPRAIGIARLGVVLLGQNRKEVNKEGARIWDGIVTEIGTLLANDRPDLELHMEMAHLIDELDRNVRIVDDIARFVARKGQSLAQLKAIRRQFMAMGRISRRFLRALPRRRSGRRAPSNR